MKINKIDIWLIASWLLFIVFVIVDINLATKGYYLSSTLETVIGVVFGAVETICCTVIKTTETKKSYDFQLEQMKLQRQWQLEDENRRKYEAQR